MSIVDDEDPQTTAKLVADATKLAIIRGLINKIEHPVLIRDALGNCAARLREDGWRFDGPYGGDDVARGVALAANVSTDLAEAVFRRDRLDLIADELRLFIANTISHRQRGR